MSMSPQTYSKVPTTSNHDSGEADCCLSLLLILIYDKHRVSLNIHLGPKQATYSGETASCMTRNIDAHEGQRASALRPSNVNLDERRGSCRVLVICRQAFRDNLWDSNVKSESWERMSGARIPMQGSLVQREDFKSNKNSVMSP